MALDSDIRDQAYEFFLQEALDLIQVIETELLTLFQDRNTSKIHSLMRAAHSIKGGAASMGLDEIKHIAHRLEDCFKALHHPELVLSADLESVFLQAFDCLKQPLLDEIETGYHDRSHAQAQADITLALLESCLEGFIGDGAYLPNSIELGVDIAKSIFEVDVQEGIDRLAGVCSANATIPEIASELRALSEVFIGIAELLNLSGFAEIAQFAYAAIDAFPERSMEIAQIALMDFRTAQQAVLAGDRTIGGSPSEALRQYLMGVDRPAAAITPNLEVIWENDSTVETGSQSDLIGNNVVVSAATANPDLWGTDTPVSAANAHPDLIWVDETAQETVADSDLIGAGETVQETTSNLDLIWAGVPVSEVIANPDLIWADVPVSEVIANPDLNWADEPVSEAIVNPDLIWVDEPASEAIANPDLIWADVPVSDVIANPDLIWADVPVSDVIANPNSIWDDQPALTQDMSTQTATQPVEDWVQSIVQNIEDLPKVDSTALLSNPVLGSPATSPDKTTKPTALVPPAISPVPGADSAKLTPEGDANQATVRVPLDRLEQMNNQIGELVINRNSLSLQNGQLQKTVQELLRRFSRFQSMALQLRDLSDQRLVALERSVPTPPQPTSNSSPAMPSMVKLQTEFDSLEMDSYGEMHLLVQSLLEDIAQLEENTGDIGLLAKQTSHSLNAQRQMLSRVQEDLMWARMLPVGQVFNRFPRVLRDLALEHHKQVDLKLSGTGVLVDKSALEQLYSPLMHILRNAFDHGIETPDVRLQSGKPEEGKIEIRAYHRGNQTIIEVQDDGRGVNYERIRERVVALDWVSIEDAMTLSQAQLLEFIFQPGFSTAQKITDLSGRGVGLDVVRSQVQALKGTVTISSVPHQGTTFTLRIPLTLTVNKLLVCLVGSSALALPSDSVEEILVPKPEQIKANAQNRLLYWHNQLIPIQNLADVLDYSCPLPSVVTSTALTSTPIPADWALPMLILQQGQHSFAIEVDRIVTEQELVIKPFGNALTPPSYLYGCTTLGDGSLVPVLDGIRLLEQMTQSTATEPHLPLTSPGDELGHRTNAAVPVSAMKTVHAATPNVTADTILIVDDSIALRQTLALTLQKAGYQVLQARDGREALERLQQNRGVQLVICDVEMPVMNGFEFLSHRRQDTAMLEIPVAMLTSRSNDKHRRLALHLGATAYFIKPYIEQEFLGAIAQLKRTNAVKAATPAPGVV